MQSQQSGPWVPAALSGDLPAGSAMPVPTPQGQLALWRSAAGRLSAFADRCPHRGMRLSHGFVRGEALSCIYHGWSYRREGNCLRIPAHPGLVPPAAIRVASHSVEEAGGIIWIAAEEPAGEPPSLGELVPLRAMTARAGLAAVEAAAGREADVRGLVAQPEGSRLAALLVAPQGEGQTLLVALVEPGSDAAGWIAASRDAEGLRRTAEAAQARRIAA